MVIATHAAGRPLDESVRYNTQMEKLLLAKFPDEVEHVWSRIGTAEVATDPMGVEQTDIFITLKPRRVEERRPRRTSWWTRCKTVLEDLPGMQLLFTQPIEQRINEMIAGIRGDVGVKIFGDDFEPLDRLRRGSGRDAAQNPRSGRRGHRAADADCRCCGSKSTRTRSARYGVAGADVLDTVQALGTPPAGEVREGQRRFPLVVRLAEPFRRDPEAVGAIAGQHARGARLPLSRLARIVEVEHAGHDLARMGPAADRWCSATSAAATWDRSWPRPRRRSAGCARSGRRAIASIGADSSSTCSGRRGGWRSSCRWPAC